MTELYEGLKQNHRIQLIELRRSNPGLADALYNIILMPLDHELDDQAKLIFRFYKNCDESTKATVGSINILRKYVDALRQHIGDVLISKFEESGLEDAKIRLDQLSDTIHKEGLGVLERLDRIESDIYYEEGLFERVDELEEDMYRPDGRLNEGLKAVNERSDQYTDGLVLALTGSKTWKIIKSVLATAVVCGALYYGNLQRTRIESLNQNLICSSSNNGLSDPSKEIGTTLCQDVEYLKDNDKYKNEVDVLRQGRLVHLEVREGQMTKSLEDAQKKVKSLETIIQTLQDQVNLCYKRPGN